MLQSNLLEARTKDEILELAAKIEAANKAKLAAKELKRSEDSKILIDSIKDLAPEKSEKSIADLLKIGKAKDFNSYFVAHVTFKGKLFTNVCKYNGIDLVIKKEDETTSIKSLPWKSFVKYHLVSFESFLTDKNTTCLISDTCNKGVSAEEVFESFTSMDIEIFASKGSKDIDTNKAKIYTNTLQNKGLKVRNSENRKAEILAQKEAKNAAKKKAALSKIEAANKVLAKLS
jgi:hypothetical protein